ncbi:MAG: hypothetical protein JZU64_04145, partial [Rhodoferax sp.]|nr:hypothetical protein [Rhodoferax sp.]
FKSPNGPRYVEESNCVATQGWNIQYTDKRATFWWRPRRERPPAVPENRQAPQQLTPWPDMPSVHKANEVAPSKPKFQHKSELRWIREFNDGHNCASGKHCRPDSTICQAPWEKGPHSEWLRDVLPRDHRRRHGYRRAGLAACEPPPVAITTPSASPTAIAELLEARETPAEQASNEVTTTQPIDNDARTLLHRQWLMYCGHQYPDEGTAALPFEDYIRETPQRQCFFLLAGQVYPGRAPSERPDAPMACLATQPDVNTADTAQLRQILADLPPSSRAHAQLLVSRIEAENDRVNTLLNAWQTPIAVAQSSTQPDNVGAQRAPPPAHPRVYGPDEAPRSPAPTATMVAMTTSDETVFWDNMNRQHATPSGLKSF